MENSRADRFKFILAMGCLWVFLLSVFGGPCFAKNYTWLKTYNSADALVSRIPAPPGYRRTEVPPGSFQEWLRHLPLKPGTSPVFLYNGRKKSRQDVHAAVVNIDVGRRDLQQCADAVIRLRAEYLYAQGWYGKICFNFTSGHKAPFIKWSRGFRPQVNGSRVTWKQIREKGSSYATFRAYLKTVFMYAGSYSLEKELQPVDSVDTMQIGDVFIQGGFPGHAVLVVDMAAYPETGQKVFLLAQSYMPAQDIHILRNPGKWRVGSQTPWYPLDFGDRLVTPEWMFRKNQLRRFQQGNEPDDH